jgi:hypothetical protein
MAASMVHTVDTVHAAAVHAAGAVHAVGRTAGINILAVDPTGHGSNLSVVAALAVGILVLIGLLVFLITRRGRRGPGAGTGPDTGAGPDEGSG